MKDLKTPPMRIKLIVLLSIMVIPVSLNAQNKKVAEYSAEFKVSAERINQPKYALVTYNQLKRKFISGSQNPVAVNNLNLTVETSKNIGVVSTAKLVAPATDLSGKPVVKLDFKKRSAPASKDGFFNKKKYWLIGAAAFLLTSTVWMVSTGNGSSGSTPNIPIPPGRPNM